MTTPTVPPTMTIGQAFKILGLVGSVSSSQEIVSAFRSRVRFAADGTGGFRGDMDVLTQAKEFLLAALARAQEEAQKEQVRKNAQEAERKEKERQKKRAQEKKATPKTEPLRLLGEATESRRYEAIRILEWKREIARKANTQIQQAKEQRGAVMKSDKSKQTLVEPQTNQIVGILSLLQERVGELEEIRQKEQEILQELSRVQARRADLEKMVQTASTLTEQLRTILESVAL